MKKKLFLCLFLFASLYGNSQLFKKITQKAKEEADYRVQLTIANSSKLEEDANTKRIYQKS